jgi:hypothetical protein
VNLCRLLGRVFVAGGAVEIAAPTARRAVFRVPAGWIQEHLPALASAAQVACDLRPQDLPADQRHARGLALDEVALFHAGLRRLRFFAGSGIDPQTRQPAYYVAIESKSRKLGTHVASILTAQGATQLAAASPDQVPLP